ncbi:MAG: hypothetical protein C3F02_04970 [Parcubacteria group bacterium]|nr:MAG: hypothetical protein C3F02_04970 [Parcubacteria group bacterium]
MNKKYYFLVGVIGLLLTTTIVSLGANAFQGRISGSDKAQIVDESSQALETAITNNDFNAWLSLMNAHIQQEQSFVTQDNFSKLVQISQLIKAGKYEEARTLQDQLGMPGTGFGPMMMGPKHAGESAAVQAALEAGDYDAWVNAVGASNKLTQTITRDNFSIFVRMHQAIKSGDFTAAQQLRTQLGLPEIKHMGHSRGGWRGEAGTEIN